VVIVGVQYSEDAQGMVKVRWLYSPDGSHYDTPEDADNLGNYYEFPIYPGYRQATLIVPILTPYIRISITNQDTYTSVVVDAWTLTLR
jgi:hypothetical protein